MNTWRWWRCFCIGLLAAGLALATTGCGDDDEEEGGGTVVTNVVNGTPVVVTNDAPAGDADEAADEEDIAAEDEANNEPEPAPPAEAEAAPQPLEPDDGAVIRSLVADIGVPVTFRWGAVPGAIGYLLEVNGAQYDRDNQQITLNFRQSLVPYTWFVRAFRADMTLGPPSAICSFSIQRQ